MVHQHQTSDAQLRIGEPRDSQERKGAPEFDAAHRPEMTAIPLDFLPIRLYLTPCGADGAVCSLTKVP
jgi:hypothetical protein